MTIFISIVAFLIIIVVLILVHEIGHFITAKASRVRVEELHTVWEGRFILWEWAILYNR